LGRVFLPEEDAPGKPPTVLLTHGLWQRRFGGDPKIIGRELSLNGDSHTIVGVLPKDFSLDYEVMPTVGGMARPELFLPLPLSAERLWRICSWRAGRRGEKRSPFARPLAQAAGRSCDSF